MSIYVVQSHGIHTLVKFVKYSSSCDLLTKSLASAIESDVHSNIYFHSKAFLFTFFHHSIIHLELYVGSSNNSGILSCISINQLSAICVSILLTESINNATLSESQSNLACESVALLD